MHETKRLMILPVPLHYRKLIDLVAFFFCTSKVKMVNELLEGVHLVAAVEAISLGSQAGVHPWILYDIISNAAGNSWYACYKGLPSITSNTKVFQYQNQKDF